MILSKLVRDRDITIYYYQDGSLATLTGKVYKLDTIQQTLCLKDGMDKVRCIDFFSIVRVS